MNKQNFPWFASAIGLLMLIVLYFAGAITTPTQTALPLLMVLFMSELGGLVSAVGAVVGARNWLAQRSNIQALTSAISSALFALALLSIGLSLWQQNMVTPAG